MTTIRPPIGPAALALDELLSDPVKVRLLTALVDTLPTADRDQAAAAARDAEALVRIEATAIRGIATQIEHRLVADWIRLSVLTAAIEWAAGRAATCMHAPTPNRPEPVFAVAWRPALVTCLQCIYLTALPRGSEADRRCDCCGRVVAGLDHHDGIHPGRVQLGPLIYAFGACRDCNPDHHHGDTDDVEPQHRRP